MDDQQLQVWRDKLAKRRVQQWAEFARKAAALTGHDPVIQAWTMQEAGGVLAPGDHPGSPANAGRFVDRA
jgi:hypothetical protein